MYIPYVQELVLHQLQHILHHYTVPITFFRKLKCDIPCNLPGINEIPVSSQTSRTINFSRISLRSIFPRHAPFSWISMKVF
ncbi:MAG: hypothetical protein QG646_2877 [Euryarchaeota archaeon]|nr:hypothetical protein [Euryarchaeota archaeon]